MVKPIQAVAIVAVAAALGACTTTGSRSHTHPSSTPRTQPNSSSTPHTSPGTPTGALGAVPGGVPLTGRPCQVALPAAWRARIDAGILWSDKWDRLPGGTPTTDGSGVLHEEILDGAAVITVMGAHRRVIDTIATIPGSGGQLTFNAADQRHIAFVYSPGNGQAASYVWQLYLWDRTTHKLTLVATNPTDGHGNPLPGGWVTPQLTDRYLYWIQAAPDVTGWGGSALLQYSFDAGRTRTLYQGLTQAFVPYGHQVLFTALRPDAGHVPNTGQGAPSVMAAVDQNTGARVAPPARITAAGDQPNEMVTNGDLILWSSNDGGVRAWRPSWDRSIDLIGGLQNAVYLRLTGHYAVWNNTILDLRTNSYVHFPNDGETGGAAGTWVSFWAYTSATSYDKEKGLIKGSQYIVDASGLPELAGCSSR